MMDKQYTELSGSAALAYAEVLDNALAKDVVTGEGFSFISAKRGNGTYWYLQHSLPKPKKQYYLGPDTPELLARIEQQKARWEAGKVDAEVLQKQVAMAIAGGCLHVSYQAYRVLNSVAEAGLFKAGGVLVGSYAFAALGNMLGVSWRKDTTITQDVDFAGSQECMVALPSEPLRDVVMGADVGMLEVPMFNPNSPSTSFNIKGKDFRVDLITPLAGKPKDVQYVKEIKSYAQPVAFLEYLLEDTQKAVLLYRSGVIVNVPNPARYALHKLVVAQRRRAAERVKSRKDIAQATQVIACLLDQSPGDLWLALDAASEHPSAKFQKTLHAGIAKLDDELRQPLEAYLEAGM